MGVWWICTMTDKHNHKLKKKTAFKKKYWEHFFVFSLVFFYSWDKRSNMNVHKAIQRTGQLQHSIWDASSQYYPLNMVGLHWGLIHLMTILGFRMLLDQPKCSSLLHLALCGELTPISNPGVRSQPCLWEFLTPAGLSDVLPLLESGGSTTQISGDAGQIRVHGPLKPSPACTQRSSALV